MGFPPTSKLQKRQLRSTCRSRLVDRMIMSAFQSCYRTLRTMSWIDMSLANWSQLWNGGRDHGKKIWHREAMLHRKSQNLNDLSCLSPFYPFKIWKQKHPKTVKVLKYWRAEQEGLELLLEQVSQPLCAFLAFHVIVWIISVFMYIAILQKWKQFQFESPVLDKPRLLACEGPFFGLTQAKDCGRKNKQ